ncbi:hypothetical protein MKW98_008775 [Papaver atlanticum]|uniref:RRM domain-containing protein n=1 Tax=Papaver atlanticum TaxID=357466 RepID=A0AAD4TBB5_9MAGN|nr:hypothetical protein MKW98_008775 [Papaver atlanticum]
MAATVLSVALPVSSSITERLKDVSCFSSVSFSSSSVCMSFPSSLSYSATQKINHRHNNGFAVVACLPSSSSTSSINSSTTTNSIKLYISGLSFRTTEESLRNAFQNFGELVEVNLVMDKVANRPRGFAFLRYSAEEESKKAIEGMHGKFLDGRVIFVEIAKPRSELRQSVKQNPRQY